MLLPAAAALHFQSPPLLTLILPSLRLMNDKDVQPATLSLLFLLFKGRERFIDLLI